MTVWAVFSYIGDGMQYGEQHFQKLFSSPEKGRGVDHRPSWINALFRQRTTRGVTMSIFDHEYTVTLITPSGQNTTKQLAETPRKAAERRVKALADGALDHHNCSNFPILVTRPIQRTTKNDVVIEAKLFRIERPEPVWAVKEVH